MRKIMSLMLIAVIFLMAACGNQTPTETSTPVETPDVSETVAEPVETTAPAEETKEAATSESSASAVETTDDATLQLVLDDAKLKLSEVEVLLNETAPNPRRNITLIKFIHGDQFYFYKVVDGVIQAKESHPTSKLSDAARKGEIISEEKAKEIALKKAGVSASEISDYEIDFDTEDGHYVYEIEFDVGDTEYEYDIDIYTGEIIKEDIDD